ncbi:unnamed protein product, partial [Amoebophrya sp. A120]
TKTTGTHHASEPSQQQPKLSGEGLGSGTIKLGNRSKISNAPLIIIRPHPRKRLALKYT